MSSSHKSDLVFMQHATFYRFTGTETTCLNLGSYNYLGFAESTGPCAEAAIKSIEDYGLAFCSTRSEFGTCPLHIELEELTAKYVFVLT